MGSEVSKNNDGLFTSPGPIMYFSIILKVIKETVHRFHHHVVSFYFEQFEL